jgi:hypothetical protein
MEEVIPGDFTTEVVALIRAHWNPAPVPGLEVIH